MTAKEFVSKLEGVRRSNGGWQARCPAHEDRRPSLSITEKDGKLLLHCHAGCTNEAIVSALGLDMRDLFTNSNGHKTEGRREVVRRYEYRDAAGQPVGRVVRTSPKDFYQERPDGNGGWEPGGFPPTLYGLPNVLKARSVLVVEGEKDCETAKQMGLAATCNPGGAGKWRPDYAEALKGKRVVVVADADAPGLAHGRDVARELVGTAESVKLIEALPQAKDLTEWVEQGGTRERLLEIIRETPELTAADIEKWEPPKPVNGGFSLVPIGELLSRPETPLDWVWAGRLAAGTVSAVVAKPKVGKSTLARNLCLAVARGETFLGASTRQGPCIYLALEERREDVVADFRALGATKNDPIDIHADTAPAAGSVALVELVRERKPALVVIDPLFRMVRIRDEKAYAETYTALGPLVDVARSIGTHVMVTHHSGKGLKADPIDSPLGSTAIGGAVSSLIVLKRTEAYRTIQTVQRLGQDMPETVLTFDRERRTLGLGAERSQADVLGVADEILRYLEGAQEGKTEPEINEVVEGRDTLKRRAIRQLVANGKIERSGSGKRGDPFVYRFLFPCFPTYTGNKGTRNRKTRRDPHKY